jgi:hypothetical protein
VQRRVTLTREEDERLRRARAHGVSEEEVIRDAVLRMLDADSSQTSDRSREGARQEWEQVLALIRARAGLTVSPEERAKGRGWMRAVRVVRYFLRHRRVLPLTPNVTVEAIRGMEQYQLWWWDSDLGNRICQRCPCGAQRGLLLWGDVGWCPVHQPVRSGVQPCLSVR